MEIAVWAEKYRPKRLSEVINQKHVVERVKAFVEEKNIPHMLFAGPAGTGKTTVALCIARELYEKNWRQNVLELNASVTPDTPILIKEGKKIKRTTIGKLAEEVFNKKEERCKEIDGIEILSIGKKSFQVEFEKIRNISRHKVNEIARIKLECGGELKTSLNHSVIVFDEKGELKSKQVRELKSGDYLISFVTELKGEKEEIDISNYKPVEFSKLKSGLIKNPKVNRIFRTIKINDKLAYFFGSYIAEGCLSFKDSTSGQIILSFGFPQEINEVNKVRRIVESNLNLVPKLEKGFSGFDRSRDSSINLRIFNTQLAKFFISQFYSGGKTAKFKKVPDFVYSIPVEKRLSLLKGYLNDGCGEWGKYVRYSSRSENLLIDIAWLARISGLFSSIFENEARISWFGSASYKKSELLPAKLFISLAKKIKLKKGNWRYLLRHNLYSKKSKFLSKKNAHRFIQLIEKNILTSKQKEILENLKKLVNSSLHVVKVKKIGIEKYNDWVYDVSVENSEMFFGGKIPILLHNSDARGIDVIRGQVKDFARTKAIGEIPYRIIILDEADALTQEAQNALRRTMESYTSVSRFILICNYSSKIIEPLKSRTAVFRFKPLSDADIRKFIERIVKGEKLKISEDGIKAVIEISEGDLRKVTNLLQTAASVDKKITADTVYEAASRAKPTDVKEMLELTLDGKFEEARKKLQEMILHQGLSGEDIIAEVHRQIYSLPITEEDKVRLVEKCGEYEFRLSEGGSELIQLEALLAQFLLFSKQAPKKS